MPSDYANDLMARVGLDTTEWKKGITDLNAGLKHIETGFQASAAMMDDWSNNSDGLRKRIDTLNDKLAIQKQKLEILKKAYEEEVAANGESSKAAEELAKKMYATQNEIKRTQSNIKSYTDKLVELGDTAGRVADKLEHYAQKTRALSAVSVAGLAAIATGLVKAGQNADELNTLAKQTGLTVEEIQKFKYASDLIDVSLEDMTGALRKMTRNMISTSSEVKTAWETLGVATVGANGKARDAVEVFYDLLEALSNVRNETERDQLAMLILGKSANDLAGIVDDGGKTLRELGDEAENLGLIMSQDAVDGANKFNDAIDSMKAKTKAAIGKAFSENAEKLAPAMESLADTIVSVVNALANMPSWAQKSAVQILAIGAAISPVLSLASKASKVISTIKKMKLVKSLKQTKTAMDATASSTNVVTAATTRFGSAMKTAVPLIGGVIIALGELQNAYEKAKEKIVDSINSKYDAELKKAEETYAQEVEEINQKITKIETMLHQETQCFEDEYDKRIEAAEKYADEEIQRLKEDQKAKEKAHRDNLKRIEIEREAAKQKVDDATNTANAELQAQIDAIDKEIEQEEKLRQDAEEKQKLHELQLAVDAARTMADKRNAEKELAAYIADQEKKKTDEARQQLKEQLKNQIDINNQKADKEKEIIDQNFEYQKEMLEADYEAYEESLDLKLEYYEEYVEKETEIAKQQLERQKNHYDALSKIAISSYEATLDTLEKTHNSKVEDLENDRTKETSKVKPTIADTARELLSDFDGSPLSLVIPRLGLGSVFIDLPSLYAKLSDKQKEKLINKLIESEGISRSEALKMVGANAKGTNFWRGGLTRINEEGGEILNLPRGTQIIPHDVSMEMARSYGQQAAITNNTTTNHTNNSYNYGAQQQVTVLEISGQKVANVIQPTVSVGLARSNISRGRALGNATKRI